MNPWLAKALVLLAAIVMVVIRAPHGQRSRTVAVKKTAKGKLEVALLALAWISFFVPLTWIATPLLAFADYPLRPVPLVAGGILLAYGLYLFHRSHADLGTNWSITLEVREKHTLVTEGIYRTIRHPMYLALLLYGLGQALVLPNWIAGPSYLFALAVLFALRVGAEERLMLDEFGAQYEEYRARTKRLIPGVWALALVLVLGVSHGSAEETHDLAYHVRAATEAYAAKDYPGFLDASRKTLELLPDHPRLRYNLACAYALNGRSDEAAALLDGLAAMGLYYAVAEDADFASVRDAKGIRDAIDRFQANLRPVHHAEPAFTLEQKGLIAEGLAYDKKKDAFFVGSVHERKILRVDAAGKAKDFVSAKQELFGAFGMRVDAKRKRLWVATSALPQMSGFRNEDEGHSGILEIDARTGAILRAHAIPGTTEKHNVADLTLDAKGNVYATDSTTPAIYFLDRKHGTLQCLDVDAPFVSPQGLALSADEKKLYVADYARGIFIVDLKSRQATKLAHPDTICLHGIDGLAMSGSTLYATQNGIRPKRVVAISLDPGGLRAERLDVLEANTPALGEPTLGVIVEGWYYFVADSGWDQVDDTGKLASNLRPHTILKVKL